VSAAWPWRRRRSLNLALLGQEWRPCRASRQRRHRPRLTPRLPLARRLEPDQLVPPCPTAQHELLDRAIIWDLHQLEQLLGEYIEHTKDSAKEHVTTLRTSSRSAQKIRSSVAPPPPVSSTNTESQPGPAAGKPNQHQDPQPLRARKPQRRHNRCINT